jgi:hypothetical protein
MRTTFVRIRAMQQTASLPAVVEPTAVTITREFGADHYQVALRLRPTGPLTEWLVVTPGHRVHPAYQPQHWLGTGDTGLQGSPEDLPRTVTCSANVGPLDAGRSHQAVLYVLFWRTPDDVAAQRITVTVTAARAQIVPVAPAPASEPRARSRPASRSAFVVETRSTHPPRATSAPGPARPRAVEKFCGGCGRAYSGTEKFCPKDGRKRRMTGSA